VPVHIVTAGGLGGTASWGGGAELELPAGAAAWSAAVQGGGSGDEPGAGPVLLLNVWSRATSGTAAGGRGSAGGCLEAVCLIGSAVADLSMLPAAGSSGLRDWFDLVSADMQLRGRLKAAVRPNAPLRAQLQALHAAAGSPPAPPAPIAASVVASVAMSGGEGSPEVGWPKMDASMPAAAAAPASSAVAFVQAQPGRQEVGQQSSSVAASSQQHEEQDAVGDAADQADLLKRLNAQLAELGALSQRLAGEPPPPASGAPGGAGASSWAPGSRSAELGGQSSHSVQFSQFEQQQQEQQGVMGHVLADSEGEEDAWPAFDARRVCTMLLTSLGWF
jgi:hypothetical protein